MSFIPSFASKPWSTTSSKYKINNQRPVSPSNLKVIDSRKKLERSTPPTSAPASDILKIMMKDRKLSQYQQRLIESRKTTDLPLHDIKVLMDKKKPAQKQPRFQRIRTFDTIVQSGAYEMEEYRPRVFKDREKEKSKLQNETKIDQEELELKLKPVINEDVLALTMLKMEIMERYDFLNDMKLLGKEKQYKAQIESEIELRERQIKKFSK